jgi:hypothetical protein
MTELLILPLLPAKTSGFWICIFARGESAEQAYTQPGAYVDTLQTSSGCDSIRTLNLTVIPKINSMVDLQICQGDTYDGYSQSGVYADTLTSSAGCDSIRTLQLTVASALTSLLKVRLCQGAIFEGYTQTGSYLDTLSSVFGCDSIRMLDIELIPEQTSTIHTTGCTTFSDDHPQSSFYLDTLQSFEGCDSIVTVYVDGYRLYIPNVFSPNDDEVNDQFEVYAFPSEPGELESFLIFDRFGDLVYSAENWPVKWDGKR